jgi:hypothetical protein
MDFNALVVVAWMQGERAPDSVGESDRAAEFTLDELSPQASAGILNRKG